MKVFIATCNQTAFLFLFILLGYLLARWKRVPANAQGVLSRLENDLFIPALVLGTFMDRFTPEKLTVAWELLLGSFALALVAIALSLVCVRFCTRDPYERSIYTYGLSFSNFGFMGNAVVSALFPDIFLEYLIFTLPLWNLIYLWGVPSLLMDDGKKQTLAQRAKRFVNPMFVSMLLGMVIGLTELPVPDFLRSGVSVAGSCMSPIAMLLTGMTVAAFDLKDILRIKGVYLVTALRLLVFPLLFLGFLWAFPMSHTFSVCGLCSLAMPLGLNTIIIPNALGKDTRVASGMALVSHVLACVTIPVILMLFPYLPK